MEVKELFAKKIDREISGVVMAENQEASKIRLEIEEYIVTKEIKKHLLEFCNYFGGGFSNPVGEIGVWISGHFGSGKSHLLKMLAYLLANKEVAGAFPLDLFREKFSDDLGSFMTIEQAVGKHTNAILFDIDAASSAKKDSASVLHVFAKKILYPFGLLRRQSQGCLYRADGREEGRYRSISCGL